ncbi:MAG: glycosyltransferase [Ignavibacteria bacterium]|nr:glycosyltransferase [Ignavibacteria bacterium]
MIPAISALLLIFASLYFIFLARIRHGLARAAAARPLLHHTPTVSIIVAARNEEQHIEECIQSILLQDYPSELMEIIVVDDSSSDTTRARIRSLAAEDPRIMLVVEDSMNAIRREGKPQALTLGVYHAQHEIVLVTDADCIVSAAWVQSIVAGFAHSTTMVMGPVVEQRQGSFFSALQGLEAFGIVVVTAGLVGLRQPLICIGANFAFRRSTFLQVDGFGSDHEPWVESIMKRIDKKNPGGVRFSMDQESIVYTRAPSSVREFFGRRIRWGAVKPHYKQIWGLAKLTMLYVFFLVFLLASILALHFAELRPLVASVWFFKLLFEFQTLVIGATYLRQRISFGQFLVAELFHVPYIVIVGALAQLLPVRWKGRTISR